MPYLIPDPRTEYERAVQDAGYPWVQTVKLHPFGQTDQPEHPFRIFDRLDNHSHQSSNTHLIITGQLTLYSGRNSRRLRRSHVISADTDDSRQKEAPIKNGTVYRGEAGATGAVFVEGHSILSPATADRFERRGALVWFDDELGTSREEWLNDHREQRLAEGVSIVPIDQEGLWMEWVGESGEIEH